MKVAALLDLRAAVGQAPEGRRYWRRLTRHQAWLAAKVIIIAISLMLVDCEESADQSELSPVLVVALAAAQPEDATNGVLLIVQHRGGQRLFLRTRGGALAPIHADTFQETLCIEVPQEQVDDLTELRLIVRTDEEQSEAIFSVALLGDGEGNGGDDPCSGRESPLRTFEMPVQPGTRFGSNTQGEPDAGADTGADASTDGDLDDEVADGEGDADE
jgi:hypothetical protein